MKITPKLSFASPLKFLCLFTLFITGCSLGKVIRPEVSLVDLRFENATLFETEGNFTVRLDNENDQDITVQGAVYRIYLNGNYIGKGMSRERVTIPSFGSATQNVKVQLSNISMVRRITEILESEELQYKVDGRLDISGLPDWGTVDTVGEGVINFKAKQM